MKNTIILLVFSILTLSLMFIEDKQESGICSVKWSHCYLRQNKEWMQLKDFEDGSVDLVCNNPRCAGK